MAYTRPPVVEAVIDIGFSSKLGDRDLVRARDKLARRFPHVTERMNVAVKIEGVKTTPITSLAGYQMNAESGLDLVILQASNFATSRLAPYESWESLKASASENLDILNGAIGRQSIGRVSTRFVNRVDVPDEDVLGRDLDIFFQAGALLPEKAVRDFGTFTMQASVVEAETGLESKLIVQSTQPALLAHQSFIIDIDVVMRQGIPLRTEEMWMIADKLRIAKNNLFEACITDRARELFR